MLKLKDRAGNEIQPSVKIIEKALIRDNKAIDIELGFGSIFVATSSKLSKNIIIESYEFPTLPTIIPLERYFDAINEFLDLYDKVKNLDK